MKFAMVQSEKPRLFICDCGEQFMLATWKYIQKDDTTVVRWINNKNQFAYCPFCAGRMRDREMEVSNGPN